MTIQTKYSIDDRVWVMANNRPQEVIINGVATGTNVHGTETRYTVLIPINAETSQQVPAMEAHLFPSKEELVASL